MIFKIAIICCLAILPLVLSIDSPGEWNALADSHTIINNALKPVRGNALNCGPNGFLYPAKLLAKNQPEKDVVVKVYKDNAVGDTEFGIYNILDAIKAPGSEHKELDPEAFGVPAVYYYGEYAGKKLMAITPMEKTLKDVEKEFSVPKSKPRSYNRHANNTAEDLDDKFSMGDEATIDVKWDDHHPEQKKRSANIIRLIRDVVWATKYIHSKAIVHTNITSYSICFHRDRAFILHFQNGHKMTETSRLEVGSDDWKSFLDCFSRIINIELEWALHDPEDLPDAGAIKKHVDIKGVKIELPDKEKSPILYISVIYDLINKLIRGEVKDNHDRFDPATHLVLRGFAHFSLYDLSDLFFKDYVVPDYTTMDMVCIKSLMAHSEDFGSIHYSWIQSNHSTTAGRDTFDVMTELDAIRDPDNTLKKKFENTENAYPELPNPEEIFHENSFAGAAHAAGVHH